MIVPNHVEIAQRRLGNTGLTVSEISFGTVELGVDYGITVPGSFGKPTFTESERVLQSAADAGLTLFDTAPTYGESESILGRVLGPRPECLFATKISIPRNDNGEVLTGRHLVKTIQRSLRQSMAALRRDSLDIVQIHNATVDTIKDGSMAEVLFKAREKGEVRCVGVSVYQEAEALAAISSSGYDVIQVAYNLLDQRMSALVFGAAEESGVGILVRSPFLKGALTWKAQSLPQDLEELRVAVERVRGHFNISWEHLARKALQFCLSSPYVSSTLVGIRTMAELQDALQATTEMPAMGGIFGVEGLALHEERLLNPTLWPSV